MSNPRRAPFADNASVQRYWNLRIHDFEVTRHPVGSPGFFADLEEYHFEKLHHLPRLINFDACAGQRVLDVGCGAGVDLVRFAQGGARVVGLDIAIASARLAHANLAQRKLESRVLVADGEALPFPDASFDLIYAHGVVQYTADDRALVDQCRRVLRRGGKAVFQVYNRRSWLNALSKIMKVDLEHQDAPVLRMYSFGELRSLLSGFESVSIVPERFPVRSRLHRGWKGSLYNSLFVGTFNAIPRSMVKRFGWHLLAFCVK